MMHRAALVMTLALLATPVFAEEGDPALHWRECSVDADCIAIQGTCNLTAVNANYKDDAVDYYKKLRAEANCVKRFWEPTKGVIPECKPIAGSEPDRAKLDKANPGPHPYSAVMNNGVCTMVPKPTKY